MHLTQPPPRAARVRPDASAAVSGARRLTCRETAERVARFAGALRRSRAQAADRMAMFAPGPDVSMRRPPARPGLAASSTIR